MTLYLVYGNASMSRKLLFHIDILNCKLQNDKKS